MKCDSTKCKDIDSSDFISLGETRVHRECMTDNDWLKKTGELYLKFYNSKESWNVMMRSLGNWNKKHSAEYICFAMSKAIKARERVTNFHSLYYIINNLNYMNMYKNKDLKIDNYVYDRVYMTNGEYDKLIEIMENNKQKVDWYINKLNDYIRETGKEYSSHFSTLCKWYDSELEKRIVAPKREIL